MKPDHVVDIDRIDDFHEIVDVRTPAEFAIDHVPRAVNLPVLDNVERAQVGTLYKRASFDARRLGAALVARNVAHHIESHFSTRGPDWKPLVYCWRGGMRSESMAHVLRQVGWKAATLRGGYRQYRRDVMAQLQLLPARVRFRVVCGPTGSGKSLLLRALAADGAQVLDLESLACHRGSLLGDLPGDPQPSQKTFESGLWDFLRHCDPSRVAYVESESPRIGALRVPPELMAAMQSAECIVIDVPAAERVRFLLQTYRHLLDDAAWLKRTLLRLVPLHSARTVERWTRQVDEGEWELLAADLLATHYDPAYRRSLLRNFPQSEAALRIEPANLEAPALRNAAASLLAGDT